MAQTSRRGGKKNRKFGRNRGTEKAKRYERKYLTMDGMMGRKIRKLMRHSGKEMTKEAAEKHWRKNRKRGVR